MTRHIRKRAPEGAMAFELMPNDTTGTNVIYWREGDDGMAEIWRYGKWHASAMTYEAKAMKGDVHSLGYEGASAWIAAVVLLSAFIVWVAI